MKAIISAACVVVLLLNSCSTVALVKLETDKNGRVSQVTVKQSSGNTDYDEYLKRLAIKNFHNKVPRPASNGVYVQPLVIEYNTLKDYVGGGPKLPE
jgi:hypothetical protein